MRYEKRTTQMLVPLSYVYGGITCYILNYITHISPLINGLIEVLGLILIIMGLATLFYRKIQDLIMRTEAYNQVAKEGGIVRVIPISPKHTDELVDLLIPSLRFDVLLHGGDIAQDIETVLRYCLRNQNRDLCPRILLDIPDYTKDLNTTQELSHLTKSFGHSDRIKIRKGSFNIYQNIIIADSYTAIFVRYDKIGSDSICIITDHKSPHQHYYSTNFDKWWDKSETIDPCDS